MEKKSRLLQRSPDGELKFQCGYVHNTYIITRLLGLGVYEILRRLLRLGDTGSSTKIYNIIIRKQISNESLILDAREASFTTKLSYSQSP